MSEYITFLSKFFFIGCTLLFSTIGINYYFNICTRIIVFKVNSVKKKYNILDEKEYLKIEGMYNIVIGILSFINFLTISFKEDWTFPVLWTTAIIANILIYIWNKNQKKFLKK